MVITFLSTSIYQYVLLHIYFTLPILDSRNERKDFNFKKKKIGDDFQDDKTRLSVLVPEFIHACLECQHFKPSDHIRMY